MKMKTHSALLALGLFLITASPAVAADVVAERLVAYQGEGATDEFSAARGREMWVEQFSQPNGKKSRSCTTCHTDDLTVAGKHQRTGKRIEPLAPSVNPERLSNAKDIEKWFLRNCKWTVGRVCTPQEKGDILTYLRDL
jgi:hypothetical protein